MSGKSAALPSFCKPLRSDGMLIASKVLAPDDPIVASGIDYWAVEACGDDEIDSLCGELYAEEAIAYAVQIDKPSFVDLVFTWITFFFFKAGRQLQELSALERAFIDTVIQKDAAFCRRNLERLRKQFPQFCN